MSWFRSCAQCSCSWGRTDLFCHSCWEDLWRSLDFQNKAYPNEQFKTSSLWSWTQNHALVATLAHAQKGRGFSSPRTRIVESYLSLLGGPKPSCLFYVSKNHKKDHGYEWALAFAHILQRPIRPLLIDGGENYKSKNRKQRTQSGRVRPAFDVDRNAARGSWFVDDIRTTGATARSAWEALNKPEDFQFVAIIHRELC